MIDDFALGLTMALMALAAMRLLARPDLDKEPEGEAVNDNPPAAARYELKLPARPRDGHPGADGGIRRA